MGLEAFQISVMGAVLAFCLFRGIEYFGWLAFRKEAMGGGDKYLAALICSFLGPRAILGLFLLSAVQGAVVGIVGLLFSGRAGPAVEAIGDEAVPPTMTWEFARPGLSFQRRLVLLPYSIFIQPIPDEPKDHEGEEVEWQPGPTNLPFGPWLALAALELMLLGSWLSTRVPVIGWVFDFNAL
jgi:leader peptidase (prepilin peptidase)/N-methyltransferase